MWLAGGDGLMPLVGASPVYRPPVAGEPLHLREDGHWSAEGLRLYMPMREGVGGVVQDYSPAGVYSTEFSAGGWGDSPIGTACTRYTDIGQRTRIPRTPATTLDVGDRFSLIVWCRLRSDLSGSRSQSILRCRKDNTPRIGISHHRDGGYWIFDYIAESGGAQFITSVQPRFGHWQMLAMVRGDRLRFYVDGVEIESHSIPSAAGTFTNADWTLGSNLRSGTYDSGPADGDIWQPMIYRRALSADEIAALHAAPDLPIWRPRRGISLALLGESSIIRYPAAHRTHVWRNGPITYVGGT